MVHSFSLNMLALLSAGIAGLVLSAEPVPVRALHCMAGPKADTEACEQFIREVLPKEGVTHLILEIGYSYQFKSHPKLGSASAMGRDDLRKLLKACQQSKIKLIPQFNCLGHQSWAKVTSSLLKKHPEFDETPYVPEDNEGIYCRSWCPLHPEVHKIVFDLLDELADACDADAFHVGMDEVFLIADPKCPRCGGKDPAVLFAGEVKKLHDHFAEKKREMWMWGDRFIDGKKMNVGKWEGSENNTFASVDQVPKDIVICDWHYDQAPDTPQFFIEKGFRVVACPWKKSDVALGQLKNLKGLAEKHSDKALGMLQTTWVSFPEFIRAYHGKSTTPDAIGSAGCFKALLAAMRVK
ncbi:MAG TPA: family 20 glycosylhydrolase [Planctomycetota bacterium]|jgi:hypothetical protein